MERRDSSGPGLAGRTGVLVGVGFGVQEAEGCLLPTHRPNLRGPASASFLVRTFGFLSRVSLPGTSWSSSDEN